MSDRPILFSGPMVRAILDGRKFQTRRILKPRNFKFYEHPVSGWRFEQFRRVEGFLDTVGMGNLDLQNLTPYLPYAVGDRLWVREAWRTWAVDDKLAPRDLPKPPKNTVRFEADGETHDGLVCNFPGRLRPGMFMPRWASRLTLTVTDVRVQRLQEISTGDCYAEGCFRPDIRKPILGSEVTIRDNARNEFRTLWNSLNAKRSPWADNPWIFALTFTAEKMNIDATPETET